MASSRGPLTRLRTFLHRNMILWVRIYYNVMWGTQIGEGTRVSLTTKIDKTYPKGIIVGRYTGFAFGSSVLTHDFVNGRHLETRIGSFCFIGARALIMPGVTIGDHCIIGSGSVVMRDVPPNSVAMGNPARVIERGVNTGQWGVRLAGEVENPAAAADNPTLVSAE